MRILPIPVFTPYEAVRKRGTYATAAPICPECEATTGSFTSTVERFSIQGCNTAEDIERFTEIVWERWACASCRTVWVEKYGIFMKKDWK